MTAYVDAAKIPFFVLTVALTRGGKAKLGDLNMVIDAKTGRASYAIFADTGPNDKLGEGSIALANALGLPADLRGGAAGAERDLQPNNDRLLWRRQGISYCPLRKLAIDFDLQISWNVQAGEAVVNDTRGRRIVIVPSQPLSRFRDDVLNTVTSERRWVKGAKNTGSGSNFLASVFKRSISLPKNS